MHRRSLYIMFAPPPPSNEIAFYTYVKVFKTVTCFTKYDLRCTRARTTFCQAGAKMWSRNETSTVNQWTDLCYFHRPHRNTLSLHNMWSFWTQWTRTSSANMCTALQGDKLTHSNSVWVWTKHISRGSGI